MAQIGHPSGPKRSVSRIRVRKRSAEQPDGRNDESADPDHAPGEIGAQGLQLRVEHVRRDVFAVLGSLADGVSQRVGLRTLRCRPPSTAGQW